MPDVFGFHPYLRQGNVVLVGKMPARMGDPIGLDGSGLPWSIRENAHIILECPFSWNKDSDITLEQLFDLGDAARMSNRLMRGVRSFVFPESGAPKLMEMRVLKARNRSILSPWTSPDPYTDDDKVVMSFDDLVTIILSC